MFLLPLLKIKVGQLGFHQLTHLCHSSMGDPVGLGQSKVAQASRARKMRQMEPVDSI